MPYPKKFTKKELTEKYQRHHESHHVCEKCGKTFPHINAKLDHMKAEHSWPRYGGGPKAD